MKATEEKRYKADFIKFLTYAQSECDETMVHLDFLFETGSINDTIVYEKLKTEYEGLSRRINKFIVWVENNLNDYGNNVTGTSTL